MWSVGKVCDAGYEVTFRKDGASIRHTASGEAVGNFHRKQWLYVGALQLRNPRFSIGQAEAEAELELEPCR